MKQYFFHRIIIKVYWRARCLFYFTKNNNLLRSFIQIGLYLTFNWFSLAFNLFKSLFKLVTDKFRLTTKKKRNIFNQEPGVYCYSVRKIVYIDKKWQWSEKLCGRIVSLLDYEDILFCLKKALYVIPYRKLWICSKITDRTVWPSLKDFYIW